MNTPRTTSGRAKKLLAAGAVAATLGIAGTAAAQNYGYYTNDGYYPNGYYANGYYTNGYYGRVYTAPPVPYYSYAPRGYGYYPSNGYYYEPAYPYQGTTGVRLGPFYLGF